MSENEHLLTCLREALKALRIFKTRLSRYAGTVPPGTLGVLTPIAAGEAAHVKDLAACCALDPSTVSRAVAALVRDGLVERAADPDDGRASVLAATTAGRAALDEVTGHYDRGLAAALAGWTPDELRTFGTLLRRFADDLIKQENAAAHPLSAQHRLSAQHPLSAQHTLEAAR
jgi:DNA-binding MarR family transcriptional regulator